MRNGSATSPLAPQWARASVFFKKNERAFCYNLIYYWSQKVFDQGKHEFLVPGNQESTRPPGNSGKRKEITRKVPEFSRKLGVPSSAMLRWAKRGEKHHQFFFLYDFYSGNPRKRSRFWSIYGTILCYFQECTKKLLESHPESGSGNHMKSTGNSGSPCSWPVRRARLKLSKLF